MQGCHAPRRLSWADWGIWKSAGQSSPCPLLPASWKTSLPEATTGASWPGVSLPLQEAMEHSGPLPPPVALTSRPAGRFAQPLES